MHIIASQTIKLNNMKRILLLLGIALLSLALASCKKDDSASLEGRWNVYRNADDPSDYTYSLIFKGNKLDVYIIAWGEHVEGTYTYSNSEITYNITKQWKAWADVTFDEKGNMKTYSWMAGDMDKDTFALLPGYDWYNLPDDDPQSAKDLLQKIQFEITSSTTAQTSLVPGPGIAHKVK